MYAKVFRSLWEGTLAGTGETWAVFVFLLAHCDSDGFVDIHPRVIASLTGFPEDRVRVALSALESQDAASRTPAEGGARLERIDAHRDWGWHVVNYQHYRTLKDSDTVRSQTRERVRRHREAKRSVTLGNAPKRQVEVEVDSTESPIGLSPSATAEDRPSVNVSETPEDRPGSTSEIGGILTLVHADDPKTAASLVASSRNGSSRRTPGKDWRESFDGHFWPAYPRKVGKEDARRAWAKLGTSPAALADPQGFFNRVMDGLEAWVKMHAKDAPEYIPHPATWLNKGRYQDEHA